MFRGKSIVLFVLLAALLLALLSPAVSAESAPLAPPSVSAQSAILIEAESGRTVYEKNADQRLPMASTTKLMTALVALELTGADTLITVSREAVGVEGSSVYLIEGEVLTLEQLLYALLLESANDAAAAIAIGLCGSIDAFAEEMNAAACRLGLMNTRFSNPHGLDDEQHYTTAAELAIIARHALQNELIARIVATRKATIPHIEENTVRSLINHNKLLRLYEGCIGLKTGFTKRSGRCLVSAAEQNGVKMIAVTLNAPDDWNDHARMLDYGFTQYRRVTLCTEESLRFSLPIVGGDRESLEVTNPHGLSILLPSSCREITYTVELPRFAFAPIAAGNIVGRLRFFCDTDGDGVRECIAETELVTCGAAPMKQPHKGFWHWLLSLLGIS